MYIFLFVHLGLYFFLGLSHVDYLWGIIFNKLNTCTVLWIKYLGKNEWFMTLIEKYWLIRYCCMRYRQYFSHMTAAVKIQLLILEYRFWPTLMYSLIYNKKTILNNKGKNCYVQKYIYATYYIWHLSFLPASIGTFGPWDEQNSIREVRCLFGTQW